MEREPRLQERKKKGDHSEKQGRPRRVFLARKIRSKWFEFLSSERRMAGAISEYWCVTLWVSMGDWLVFYCLSSLPVSFSLSYFSSRVKNGKEYTHKCCNSVPGSCAEYTFYDSHSLEYIQWYIICYSI